MSEQAPHPGMVCDVTADGLTVWRWPDIPPVLEGPPVWEWFIDIGPFLDRFGDAKMLVLASPDGNVQAILRDLMMRKWVDLKRNDVFNSLTYIRTKVPAVTVPLITSILETPVSSEENSSLRVLYFKG